MNWISVDDDLPTNDAPVLICGMFTGRPFRTLGIYEPELQRWKTLAHCEEFIMIEVAETEIYEDVKVKFWSHMPEIPKDFI